MAHQQLLNKKKKQFVEVAFIISTTTNQLKGGKVAEL